MRSDRLEVLAPFAGTVRDLDEVPDPVFAGRMLGPGVAIEPATGDGATVDVLAPADGVLSALHPHALVLTCAGGRGVLVHLGLETVALAGSGYTRHRSVGDQVSAGDVVLSWAPALVEAAGCSVLSPVVALQGRDVVALARAGEVVQPGQPLLRWS